MSEVPATYGDPTAEYLALVRGAGVVTGHHDLVWVRGPDAISFLDGLLSQTVAGAAMGTVSRSFLLAPNGKLRALLHLVFAASDAVGLVADRGLGSRVVEDLGRFKIRVEVTIAPHEGDLVEVWGPGAADVLGACGLPAPMGWEDPVAALPPPGEAAVPRFLVLDGPADALVAAGAVRCGRQAAETVRIELGEPVVGRDVDDGTIPQETGMVAEAVDFGMGCYLGQELVARIDARGRVNRHLRGVALTENVLPPPGAELVHEGAVVGRLTSLGESLDVGAPVGMALMRREVAPGDAVEVRWANGVTTGIVRRLPLRGEG
jgi:folate-binding protein YgfZ